MTYKVAGRTLRVHPSITPNRLCEAVEQARFSIGYRKFGTAGTAPTSESRSSGTKRKRGGLRAGFGSNVLLFLFDDLELFTAAVGLIRCL